MGFKLKIYPHFYTYLLFGGLLAALVYTYMVPSAVDEIKSDKEFSFLDFKNDHTTHSTLLRDLDPNNIDFSKIPSTESNLIMLDKDKVVFNLHEITSIEADDLLRYANGHSPPIHHKVFEHHSQDQLRVLSISPSAKTRLKSKNSLSSIKTLRVWLSSFLLILIGLSLLFRRKHDFTSLKSVGFLSLAILGWRLISDISLSLVKNEEVFPINLFDSTTDYLLNLIGFCWICWIWTRFLINKRKYHRLLFSLNYFSLFGMGILYSLFTSSAISFYNPILEAHGLFTMQLTDILYYLSILLIGLGVFIICFNLSYLAGRLNKNFWSKALHFLPGFALFGIICYSLKLDIDYLQLSLLLGIFAVLSDLFREKLKFDLSWILFWMILLSIFCSLLYHNAHLNSITEVNAHQSAILEKEFNEASSLESFIETRKSDIVLGSAQKQFAIFQDNHLIYSDIHPFPKHLEDVKKSDIVNTKKLAKNYSLIALKDKMEVSLSSIFSYNFALFSIIVVFLSLFESFYPSLSQILPFQFSDTGGIGEKIQFAVISSILLFFTIIGFITLAFFKKDFQNRDLAHTENIVAYLSAYEHDNPNWSHERLIDQLGIRVNNYSSNGLLQGSQISNKIDKLTPPYKLASSDIAHIENNQAYLIRDRKFGNYGYRSLLIPRLNKEHEVSDILYVQLETVNSLVKTQLDRFISTLLSVFTFLFFIAIAITVTLSLSITKPIDALRERIQNFRLGRKNESLSWEKQDEIGELIHNYNSMIAQLEESANLLAHTQRDAAWREMARQVAHEIKNPLTPMKLRVQHLQQSLKHKPENALEMIDQVASTLTEQIDNLANIASEFSNFGKLPTAKNDKIILNEVVSSVHDLFRRREDLTVNLYVPINEIYVYADKNHVMRILINLVKNAIQAIPNERSGLIEIRLNKDVERGRAVIEVKDNGTGIAQDMREKVFYPNFTTKNSGTGLGLAICSNLVELFNGKLHFKTAMDIGTTFFLEIPLMRLKDNYQDMEHVVLQ